MNSSFGKGVLAGAIAGAAAAAMVASLYFRVEMGNLRLRVRALQTPEERVVVKPPAPPDPLPALREENRRLQERVAELERPKAPPQPQAAGPDSDKGDYRALFAALAEGGLAGYLGPKYLQASEAIKAAGRPGIDFLAELLRTSKSATDRFFAAALLETLGDAAAIPALAQALKEDKDSIVRRMSSHALAMIRGEGAESPLRAAMTGDEDWGVRANSAYGLAKMEREDGLRVLRDAYETAPAEYRLGILMGLADVASPSTAPLFRKILADTKDEAYLLSAIIALEKMRDAESLTALGTLAASAPSDSVRQAAARAIEAIRK
jgi:hypothetical protein